MKRYDKLTPEGTRDLLFDECAARRIIEERLRTIFVKNAYSEVVTPGLEFYDVFSSKTRYFSQESMYKLSDAKGRLMVIRPDTTLPIARLAATRLRDEALPLKLFYNQNIFRINPKNNGRDDEIFQSGIELIGGDVKLSDIEVLFLAVDALKSCTTDDFRLEIGNSAFFKKLITKLHVSEDESEEIRSAIENKNYPELKRLLQSIGDFPEVKALAELPKLFGGAEVFKKAYEAFAGIDDMKEPLDYLQSNYNTLCRLGISDKITVDFGLVNKANYYTGILFRGYIEGYGMSVLSGGRYDTLTDDFGADIPATGFAVNINAVASVMLKKAQSPLLQKPDVLVFIKDSSFDKGIHHARKIMEAGYIVDTSVISDEEEAMTYARKKGINRVDVFEADGSVRTIINGGKKND